MNQIANHPNLPDKNPNAQQNQEDSQRDQRIWS
jgi:hypothetical protein